MIGIGPFIAHPQTPLAAAGNGELEKALKVLADNVQDIVYSKNGHAIVNSKF
jgi:hypothetical protein